MINVVEQANNGLFPFTAISSRLRTYKCPVQANKSSKTANESSFPEHKKADFLPRPLPAPLLSRRSSKFLPIDPLGHRMIARNLADIK